MARAKKNGKSVSLLMDEELYNKLEKYCGYTYLTKTATIEKALRHLFEHEHIDEMPDLIADCGGIKPADISADE